MHSALDCQVWTRQVSLKPAFGKYLTMINCQETAHKHQRQGVVMSLGRTFNDLEALPAAKLGDGFVVPPASHIRMTPFPFEARERSSRNSVFSSTGLQCTAGDNLTGYCASYPAQALARKKLWANRVVRCFC